MSELAKLVERDDLSLAFRNLGGFILSELEKPKNSNYDPQRVPEEMHWTERSLVPGSEVAYPKVFLGDNHDTHELWATPGDTVISRISFEEVGHANITGAEEDDYRHIQHLLTDDGRVIQITPTDTRSQIRELTDQEIEDLTNRIAA